MGFTTDPNDPRLGHGIDKQETQQHETYLILSEEERAKGFIRPLRRSYIHVGAPGPQYALLDLTEEQRGLYGHVGYVKYEKYPEEELPVIGRYWTQEQLDNVGKGCGVLTRMGLALCETYARSPFFYGATYCCGCSKHLDVNEFIWDEDRERVGS